jgi:peptidylprolyl isomerase
MPELPDPAGASPRTTTFDGPPPRCIDVARRYSAEMVTSKGTITLSLDPIGAPETTNNFVFLARWHYFDGIEFHRVIPGFVLQGGDPTGTGTGGPGYRFKDELPKPGRYEVGSLAMANAGPDTNGSQFFIISGPQGVALPPKYALFGKVVRGLDVVAAIEAIGTSSGKPTERVTIESVTITESD